MFDQARRDPPGSPATDRNRSTDLTPLDELIGPTPTPAQLDARRMADAHASRRCCYIKPSGDRCGSPAMRGFDLCYYHDRYQPKDGYRNLPCLEDAHSVQCAIQEIIEDMLVGYLDYKKAALALYGLQTAASNLKQMRIAEEKRAREQEKAPTVDRAPSTEQSRAATNGCSPARSAGYPGIEIHKSRRDDWNSRDDDELEEFELTADAERPTTAGAAIDPTFGRHRELAIQDDARRPNVGHPTLIESPRPPQHVTRGLRTQEERQAMKDRFPDLAKIRREILASLDPDERALIDRASAEAVAQGERLQVAAAEPL